MIHNAAKCISADAAARSFGARIVITGHTKRKAKCSAAIPASEKTKGHGKRSISPGINMLKA